MRHLSLNPIQIPYITKNSVVIGIGSLSIRIRFRPSISMPIRILPQVLHMVKNQHFLYFYFTVMSVFTVFYFSHQCQRCHSFQYFQTAY
jgi:hypothetical protein